MDVNKEVFATKWHPTVKQLATGGGDGSISIWDVLTKQCIQVVTGNKETLTALAFNGEFLASAGFDNTVSLWDVKENRLVRKYKGDSGVFEISFKESMLGVCYADKKAVILYTDSNNEKD